MPASPRRPPVRRSDRGAVGRAGVDGSVEVDWDGASGEELVLMVPPEGAPIQFVMNLPDGSGGVTEWDGYLPVDASLADVLSKLT